MNAANWHLLLNHLPIIGTYFSTILLVIGILIKNQTIKNTGLGFFILTALFAIPALLTGEGAKDVLNSIGQKNEYFINQHEKLAENAFWLSISIAIFSIGALIGWRKKKQTQILTITVLLTGLGNSILMTAAGNTGGQIRHTEIRPINSLQNENSIGDVK